MKLITSAFFLSRFLHAGPSPHQIPSSIGTRSGRSFVLAVIALLAAVPFSRPISAQTGEWTWIGGSAAFPTSGPQFGVYGTLGLAGPANVPGPRSNSTAVTDNHGNVWLFGGEGYDANGQLGYLNDLWKLDPSTDEWTWMSGSSTIPATFSGASGIYGQNGVVSPNNVPGGRWNAVGWADNAGDIWLFSGEGLDSNGLYGYLNDLWEFSPVTQEWTWMGGSNKVPAQYAGQPGAYGSLGTPASGNIPGGRWGASSWKDAQGEFWLFGGEGSDESEREGQLNDLWEFDPSTNKWAWMAGSKDLPSNGGYAPSQYGTQGVSASGNVPGGRSSAASWPDGKGKLWLFGGEAEAANGPSGALNDLWEFDPSAMLWTWISGGSTLPCSGACASTANYGTLGTSASSNVPGGRYSPSNWTDVSGNLWLFGGMGADALGNYGNLNDLWNFNTTTQEWTWTGGSDRVSQGGTYGTQGTPSTQNVPGSRNSAVTWTDGSGNLWMFGGLGTYTGGNYGYLNDLLEYQLPGFTLGSSQASVAVNPGNTASITLTVTPSNGLNSTVSFACSGLPVGVTCSFSPATVTPTSASAVTTQLTFTASSTAAVKPSHARSLLPAVSFATLVCAFLFRRTRSSQRWVLFLAAVAILGMVTACGGGSSSNSSGGGSGGSGGSGGAPESATISVTATSGSLLQTAVIALTVN